MKVINVLKIVISKSMVVVSVDLLYFIITSAAQGETTHEEIYQISHKRLARFYIDKMKHTYIPGNTI